MYQITEYTKKKARELNVTVKPSTNVKKKLDVFKDGKKIASIGDINYSDYPSYIKDRGLEYANNRRKLYRLRHKKDLGILGSNGYFANKLLW